MSWLILAVKRLFHKKHWLVGSKSGCLLSSTQKGSLQHIDYRHLPKIFCVVHQKTYNIKQIILSNMTKKVKYVVIWIHYVHCCGTLKKNLKCHNCLWKIVSSVKTFQCKFQDCRPKCFISWNLRNNSYRLYKRFFKKRHCLKLSSTSKSGNTSISVPR